MTTAATIAHEIAAGLAEAERQIALLENAGPGDLAAVVAVMAQAVDSDADMRLVAGVAALQRLLVPPERAGRLPRPYEAARVR